MACGKQSTKKRGTRVSAAEPQGCQRTMACQIGVISPGGSAADRSGINEVLVPPLDLAREDTRRYTLETTLSFEI
ncbi:hypothetical protein G3436_11285 [Pseudomonas sp. MAFF212427]|uniref:Uncharacterized protein n=1 Tax=Pseudomonas brassicae TaxID=2708063 RepID=A0A6B3NMC7_9PSED|nr:hypothetical protein [Pseudomonas brassicae]NER64365.1 hypothetical protein [Pseudomonas brassicae]